MDGAAATETKEVAIKVSTPDLFYGGRKKFKAYCTQVRLYIWADRRRETKTLKYTVDEVVWAASYLRGDAYARMEP
jgi:hypothetical protein